MAEQTTTRVQVNMSQNSKGEFQLDITTEAPTVEEASALWHQAYLKQRASIADLGLKIAGGV